VLETNRYQFLDVEITNDHLILQATIVV